MTKNGETLKYRVLQLEKCVDALDVKIDVLMTNHIPHLQEQIARLETKILMFTTINVGAIVISMLMHELL